MVITQEGQLEAGETDLGSVLSCWWEYVNFSLHDEQAASRKGICEGPGQDVASSQAQIGPPPVNHIIVF